METSENFSNLRLAAVKIVLAGGFLLLLAKIATVMVFSGEYYRGLSLGNGITEEVVPANRGVIYDRGGKILANNLPRFTTEGGKVVSKEEAFLEGGARVETARRYPYGEALAHVVGYVNWVDRKGVAGLEKTYDRELAGQDGKELWETDANGAKLRLLGKQEPAAGQDLKTTLDLGLQENLYNSLKEVTGAAVATNPETGEVLALVSSPSFDPEKVDQALGETGNPLFDRAISAAYPPGSTFKIITAAAGLESGAINRDTLLEDTGVLIIGPASPRGEPYKFANWKYLRNGGVDGWINVVGAIRQSNDLFFYQAGGKVGGEKLTETAKIFGLGKPLGIDLAGEAGGMIRREREWYLGDTYHMAIGQGDLLVTPLQVNNWTAVIANGGKLCRPHLTGKEDCRDLGFKKETTDLIKEGMRQACDTGGTAWPLFGLGMYCKTGTAEYGSSTKTHAWLTGFVKGEKPLAITVIVEGGGEGSDVAAPIVKKALEEWFGSYLRLEEKSSINSSRR